MMHKYAATAADLADQARRIRQTSLEMVCRAGLGHPGGDLSSADILATLFFHVLQIDPAHPDDPGRDRFVMSKGHASASLYATLAQRGFLPPEQLETFAKPLAELNGHPDRRKIPGVEASTGPLGHGLPVAVGMALAAKMDRADWRTFVLTGDGELQEGSNWEAIMAAGQFQLDNLTAIVDRNGLQLSDTTEHTVRLEPLADRWRSFGWSVAEVDGHDCAGLVQAFDTLPIEDGRPSCIITRTRKGRGVSFMEDRTEWHHRVPTDAELAAALAELDGGVR